MTETTNPTVYLFRTDQIEGTSTVVCVAPADVVDVVFGGQSGIINEFGGVIIYKGDDSEDHFLGVWGQRAAGRFRTRIRSALTDIEIRREPPPGRIRFRRSDGVRPGRASKKIKRSFSRFVTPK